MAINPFTVKDLEVGGVFIMTNSIHFIQSITLDKICFFINGTPLGNGHLEYFHRVKYQYIPPSSLMELIK